MGKMIEDLKNETHWASIAENPTARREAAEALQSERERVEQLNQQLRILDPSDPRLKRNRMYIKRIDDRQRFLKHHAERSAMAAIRAHRAAVSQNGRTIGYAADRELWAVLGED